MEAQIFFIILYTIAPIGCVYFLIDYLRRLFKKSEPVPVSNWELPEVITELEQVRFNTWLECSVDDDYTGLITAGEPSPERLYNAWLHLLSQYQTLTGSREAQKYAVNVAKIEALNTKINAVTMLVGALEAGYSDILAQRLKEWGYSRPFTILTLAKDLEAVKKALGNDRLKLKLLLKNHAESEKKTGKKQQKQTKEDWIKTLHAIEEHKKIVFDREKLNMQDFALYINSITEYNNALLKKHTGYGRK